MEYRSRDARKRQTLRETLAGSPKRSDGARDNLREARKRETGRERLAGSPRERNSENDARGKPAERFLNVCNMDYLKNTVLARKGSSEDEPDEGGDTPEPSPEPTPVTPE